MKRVTSNGIRPALSSNMWPLVHWFHHMKILTTLHVCHFVQVQWLYQFRPAMRENHWSATLKTRRKTPMPRLLNLISWSAYYWWWVLLSVMPWLQDLILVLLRQWLKQRAQHSTYLCQDQAWQHLFILVSILCQVSKWHHSFVWHYIPTYEMRKSAFCGLDQHMVTLRALKPCVSCSVAIKN